MRDRLLHLVLLATAACRPSAVVEPVVPERRDPVAAEVATPAVPPAPAPAPAPPTDPPPTWEWALSVLPELAEHHERDAAADALAKFLEWFENDKKARVYVLSEGTCRAISGSVDSDGFHGRWRRKVTTEGEERRDSGMDIDITIHGIAESGPGGRIYQRDSKGRWQETGAFASSGGNALADYPMSAADELSVTFAGYAYTLEPACGSTEKITQTCSAGGQRVCQRCTGVALHPQIANMGRGTGSIGLGRVDKTPVDCSQACPADEWTGLLPRLASALKGHTFAGVHAEEGPLVFRSTKACASELRRRKTAAAAARKAEAAADSP